MKEFNVTKSLVMNPKLETVNSNFKQYQFLFKYVSSKSQRQNFSN